MYQKLKNQRAKVKNMAHRWKINGYRRWYYLTVGILSFTIFILTLPKGDTIAQEKLADPGVNLITQRDQFKKVTPKDLNLSFPVYTPPPKIPDSRLIILKKYLSQFNSPLIDHAQDFLDASDTYRVDWRLVPAIAGVESTFGRSIPGGHDPKSTSYNGWGWGVYGDQVIRFNSWRDAIFVVTKGLKNNYLDKGLTDPFLINKKYASDPEWGSTLTYFLQDLDFFADKNAPVLTKPADIQNQIFQNYSYLKNEETHFSLQTSEMN